MRAKHYDLIVFGENLSGLIVAALLAARHYSVLVVRRVAGPSQDAVIGHTAGRERLLHPGVFHHPVPAAVIRELGLGYRIKQGFRSAIPLFQYIDTDARISTYSDRAKLAVELQREYGATVTPDSIGSLLADLDTFNNCMDDLLIPSLPVHPAGMKERWDFTSAQKNFEKTIESHDGIIGRIENNLQATALGRILRDTSRLFSMAGDGFDPRWRLRLASDAMRDMLFRVENEHLDGMLLDSIEKHGGEILEQTSLLSAKQGRGFQFEDARIIYSADFVVMAFDYFLIDALLDDKKISRYIEEASQSLIPSHTWVKVSFISDLDLIPEGMGHTVFQAQNNGHLPIMYLRDPTVSDGAEVDRLDLLCALPVENVRPDAFKPFQEWMIKQSKTLVPFMETHLHKVYLDKLSPPAEGLHPWSALAGRRLVYTSRREDGLFRGLSYSLPLKNAYLAAPEVLPELGLEGEFITGWAVARQITRKKPKKDDLR